MRFFSAATPGILKFWKTGALFARFGKATIDTASSVWNLEQGPESREFIYLLFGAMNQGPTSSVSSTTTQILPESRLYSCINVAHRVPCT